MLAKRMTIDPDWSVGWHRRLGFTLLEVLLAITIISLVLSMVYTILISTLKARDWIHASLDVDRAGNRILSIVARDMRAAYLYQLTDKCFVGESTSEGTRVHFLTNNDSLFFQDVASDLCEVGYYVRPNRDEPGIFELMRREDFFIDPEPLSGGVLARVYDRVTTFECKFYNVKKIVKKSWDSDRDGGLPVGVEVILGIPELPPGTPPEALKKSTRYFRTYVPILVSPRPPGFDKDDE